VDETGTLVKGLDKEGKPKAVYTQQARLKSAEEKGIGTLQERSKRPFYSDWG
jgi:hypothetical protein